MQTGEILKYLIKKSPKNQEQIALELGISQSKLSRLLNSLNISQEEIDEICEIIQVDSDKFSVVASNFESQPSDELDWQKKYYEMQGKYISIMEKMTLIQDENFELLNQIHQLKAQLDEYQSFGGAKAG